MLFRSKNSKIVHFEGCGHIKRIMEYNLEMLDTYADARGERYRLCSCCDPVSRAYKKEKDNLTVFCSQNGLICFCRESVVHLQTVHSRWKVIPSDNGGLVLYHRNTRFKKKGLQSAVAGYHPQNFKCRDIVGVCDYILSHDEYRYHNPARKDKVSEPKAPSPKGSRRWRAEEERRKRRERRQAIKKVYFIFDQLEAARTYG